MKKLFTFLIAVAISLSAFAQVTTTINGTQIKRQFVSGSNTFVTQTDVIGSNTVTALDASATSTDNSKAVFGIVGRATGSRYDPATRSATGVYGEATDGGGPGLAIWGNGDVGYSGSLRQVSDIRLKENIKILPSALDKLMKLSPKQYSFKQDLPIILSKGQSTGFIAQEVREVFPELIKEIILPVFDDDSKASGKQGNFKRDEKYMTMDYVSLIPYIVSGMQEQQKIIQQQSSLINSLLAKNEQSNYNSETLPKIISLSPNPASSTLEIVCTTVGKRGIIYIYDVNGAIVKTIQLGENNTIIVPLDGFANGVYITALFVNGAAMDTKRAVIQK